ncbi:hypothetical protein [Sporomusa malonica]|uniref:Uncharacterized protein n=1 Tax=Sporomusa malonica TaxID=112901 RepID=A0A1W2AUH8_9FIRM|nr:hypothetical protein [Sporomusa malonica]SMC64346.1 hypothetical protein SAMN04488500_106133 [Sporomusa malonica]
MKIFKKIVLEKLSNLEYGQTEILSEIKSLKQADQALLDLVEKTYRKTEQIESKLDHHANMLDVLATRTTHQEAEIKGLKIAK